MWLLSYALLQQQLSRTTVEVSCYVMCKILLLLLYYDMDFHWIWIVMKIWLVKWVPGAVSVYRSCFTIIGIPIIKIRWSHGCLIFTLGILYLKLKDSFYFEMGPMWWYIYIYWLSIPLEGYKLCTSYNSSHVTVSRLSNLHIANSMLNRTVFILK